MKKKNIKVAELFAGVGGFRLGLEKSNYEIVWSNQWEPATKMQHASLIYEARFGADNHSNENIENVNVADIPNHDLLVGGFPCQDYSVATTLHNSKGLQGKKGVLWWSIYNILNEKKSPPKYLLLENVDRLLKSPAKQRGRDFAIMLQSLNQLGYAVEWRVINAAEYGMPQRRRRVFFIGYHKSTPVYKSLAKTNKEDWILKNGVLPETFAINADGKMTEFDLENDLSSITKNFNKAGKLSPFQNSGVMIKGTVSTLKTKSTYKGSMTSLGSVLQNGTVPADFFIDKQDKEKWQYLKGAKTIERTTKDGFVYKYSEGGMIYPDALDNASRTIITGEGGKSPSRFKHVVKTKKGLRRLTPIELERLNMFPDNHTQLDGVTDTKRAFLMGNALVVGIVEKIGAVLAKRIS